ncbi:hypothetical protein KG892_04335 [Vermiphilus pyriformis]|jgi:hypothetical protein|uniref:Uncharacterized protein n=1 Tax=candidate division TM6 bacterium JCVI TM6SC1 TaxID=1306947 RepID=A0A0D2K4J9_9BACT|nr:hypothetical protein J120_02300 [candidate division TM6 bacterium JCVI TM6SC1]UNE35194.1 MAG: hypothetical protein KG892_04335 [Vermiphilus pyriformis]
MQTNTRALSYLHLFLILICSAWNNSSTALIDLDDPTVTDFVNSTTWRAPSPQSKASIVLLLSNLGFINILQEPLYCRTNTLNQRTLLDLPLFMSEWRTEKCRTFGAYFFYNQTSDMNFTSNSRNINSYLAVGQDSFINSLEEFLINIQALPGFSQFDPNAALAILNLFENFTVQERRAGVMLYGRKRFNDWALNVMAPFYYQERNYFVNQDIQNDIQEIVNSFLPGSGTEEDSQAQEEFQEQFLIADRIGIGDTRIELDYPLYCSETWKVRIGGLATLPTNCTFEKGLLGNEFELLKNRPLLDIQGLSEAITSPSTATQAREQGISYLLGALTQLSSILLNAPLGYHGHLGLGVLARSYSCLGNFINRPWAQNIKFKSRWSVEYLFPRRYTRAFVSAIDYAEFARRDFNDPAQADSNYDFIVEQLTDRLYPQALSAVVWPGVVFRSTSRNMYERENWRFFLGTDLWIRTAEHLYDIKLDLQSTSKLLIKRAQRPLAYASKLMAGIAYKSVRAYNREWIFSLNGDTTYSGSGIGNDFTLTFNIDVYF